ncbi:hypothetical protein CEP54_005803 [Fusarium duplospermum]|uniref:Uncharacterized protein n=1 Tax=Fusarium duplospermum TaxID=1325734 RepID=A0A428QA75_9HYPO|nr:hypothetical protein CEP54_005803 [Fusarium duplospermum]
MPLRLAPAHNDGTATRTCPSPQSPGASSILFPSQSLAASAEALDSSATHSLLTIFPVSLPNIPSICRPSLVRPSSLSFLAYPLLWKERGGAKTRTRHLAPGRPTTERPIPFCAVKGRDCIPIPTKAPFITSLDLALDAVTIDGWFGDWFCGGVGRLDDNLDDDGPFERDTDADDLLGHTLVTSLVFGRHMPLDPLVIL